MVGVRDASHYGRAVVYSTALQTFVLASMLVSSAYACGASSTKNRGAANRTLKLEPTLDQMHVANMTAVKAGRAFPADLVTETVGRDQIEGVDRHSCAADGSGCSHRGISPLKWWQILLIALGGFLLLLLACLFGACTRWPRVPAGGTNRPAEAGAQPQLWREMPYQGPGRAARASDSGTDHQGQAP